MSIAKIIGDRIRAYRNQKGWSQEYLAEKECRRKQYIDALKNIGWARPLREVSRRGILVLESISKIAGALGVSLSRLFENISIEQQENNLPAQCYALLQEQPVNDQKVLAEILAALIQYKKA